MIELHDIEKKAGHPSIAGMRAIADQVDDFVKSNKKKSDKKNEKNTRKKKVKKGKK